MMSFDLKHLKENYRAPRLRFVKHTTWRGGRIYKLMFGFGRWIGAGYLNGFTAYVAFNSVSKRIMFKPKPFRAGITCNANCVPWLRG